MVWITGVAVGLWSLMLRTRDGGRTWEEAELPPPPGDTRADANLMSVFGDAQWGELYDLQQDPHELDNLWDAPAAIGIKAELLQRLVCALMEHADSSPSPTRIA